MKFIQLLIPIWIVLIFTSCHNDSNGLSAINSESFHEKQILLHFQPTQTGVQDSLITLSENQKQLLKELDEMLSMTKHIRQSGSDSLWKALIQKWRDFDSIYVGNGRTPYTFKDSPADTSKGKLFPQATLQWAQLNIDLVKLSGEVRFGDALEVLLYGTKDFSFPEKLLKSVIFTHVFDQIYINIIGSSSMDYSHTTGGNVRLIQETNYPKGNEMLLKCEVNDLRYMDVFIRIPSWAVNPTVTHGNVKYVAHPGEYTQISKKWKDGEEIRVVLRQE